MFVNPWRPCRLAWFYPLQNTLLIRRGNSGWEKTKTNTKPKPTFTLRGSEPTNSLTVSRHVCCGSVSWWMKRTRGFARFSAGGSQGGPGTGFAGTRKPLESGEVSPQHYPVKDGPHSEVQRQSQKTRWRDQPGGQKVTRCFLATGLLTVTLREKFTLV